MLEHGLVVGSVLPLQLLVRTRRSCILQRGSTGGNHKRELTMQQLGGNKRKDTLRDQFVHRGVQVLIFVKAVSRFAACR